MKYFDLYESITHKGRYMLCLDTELLPEARTMATYHFLACRLLGISYPDYCRYCRDELGAKLSGKNCYYLSIGFQKNERTLKFVEELNRRIGIIKGEIK